MFTAFFNAETQVGIQLCTYYAPIILIMYQWIKLHGKTQYKSYHIGDMETLPSCFSLVRKPLNILLIWTDFFHVLSDSSEPGFLFEISPRKGRSFNHYFSSIWSSILYNYIGSSILYYYIGSSILYNNIWSSILYYYIWPSRRTNERENSPMFISRRVLEGGSVQESDVEISLNLPSQR